VITGRGRTDRDADAFMHSCFLTIPLLTEASLNEDAQVLEDVEERKGAIWLRKHFLYLKNQLG